MFERIAEVKSGRFVQVLDFKQGCLLCNSANDSEIEFLHSVDEGVSSDVEVLGRAGLVPVVFFKRLSEVAVE